MLKQQGRWLCENCGDRFDREKSGSRPIRFCVSACYHAFQRKTNGYRGTFAKGSKPWNKDLKGIHLSPATEFKKGRESEAKQPVGSVTIRHHRKEKHRRAWIKIGEPSIWVLRAVFNWQAENGPVPTGCVIHHKDRNALNDDLSNLQCMTRAEHIEEHRKELKKATQ